MAELVLQRFLDEHSHLVGPSPTFLAAADEYLRFCENDKGLRGTTLRTCRNIVAHTLKPHFGETLLSQIDVTDVIARRERMVSEGRSGQTLNQTRTVLNGIFKRARRAFAYFGPNPATEFDRTRIIDSGDLDVYSVAEVELLAEHAERPLDSELFRVGAYAGLRISELLGLRVRAVRFDLSAFEVARGFTAEEGEATPTGAPPGAVRARPTTSATPTSPRRRGRGRATMGPCSESLDSLNAFW